MDIIKILNKLGYSTVPSDFYSHIALWREWYKGKAKFHNYKVYNGIQMVKQERQSLGMAKKVSEDKADLLLNEKVAITVSEGIQGTLDSVLDENNFKVKGNQLIELSQALGTGAFVEYLEGEEIKIDYVQGDCIFPLTWTNGKITECAFASEYQEGGEKRVYLNIHVKGNNQYIVYNKMFNDDGKEIPLEEGFLPIWVTGSTTPLFQIITPNIVNNIDTNCPMGISVFANSIDLLEGIDLVYDSYDNEFRLGKKRIFVDSTMVKVNVETGSQQPAFDTNDTTFYSFPFDSGSKDSKNKAIEESDLTIRAEEHEKGLNTRLNLLSAKCGFGQNHYSFENGQLKTATEVVSENSQLFRSIKKDELILQKALTDMVKAILFLLNKQTDDISISFDDSIIEDTEAIAQRALLEKNSGLIDSIMYYQKVYGLTEEQAIKLDKKIQDRKPKQEVSNFFEGE